MMAVVLIVLLFVFYSSAMVCCETRGCVCVMFLHVILNARDIVKFWCILHVSVFVPGAIRQYLVDVETYDLNVLPN